MREEVKEFIQNNKLQLNSAHGRVKRLIRLKTVADAEKCLSNIIHKFQGGEIDRQEARDLTYLLINFVNIRKAGELEAKLNSLLKDMNILKGSN
jgi:hypothetical protein